ncbi:MAG: hypothetical protein IPP29_16345 [Bacteroidetes bacterium]|nr:hypothetical protein [Bacteroidota bacterium]
MGGLIMAAFAEVNFTSFGLGATSTLTGRLRLGLDFTTATGGATGAGLAATATGFTAFLATGATIFLVTGFATGFTTFLALATGFTTFFGLGFTAFVVGLALQLP